MSARIQISKGTRFNVLKRDGFTCQYCGGHPPEKILHVDHINPVSNGGDNSTDILVTSCSDCNLAKGPRLLTDIPKSLKDRAEEIRAAEEQLLGYYAIIQEKKERIEDEMWEIAELISKGCSTKGFKKVYLRSIKMFIERLGYLQTIDAAEITNIKNIYSESSSFKYFAAVCWNKIRRQQNGES